MTTFDRYLLKRFLHSFVILFVSTYGLFIVIDGFTNVDGFQQGREGTVAVLQRMATYYGCQATLFFDMLASILSVVSVMIVFALLQKNSEFHPILAAGIPTYRMLLPVAIGVLLIDSVIITNQEVVIPLLANHLQTPRNDEKSDMTPIDPTYDRRSRIHFDGKALSIPRKEISQAEVILPVPDIVRDFTSLKAEKATYVEETEGRPAGWILSNVAPKFSQLHLSDEGARYVHRGETDDSIFIVSDLTFDQLNSRSQNYRYLTTPALMARLKNPSFGELTYRTQLMHFHSRLVRPFLDLMVLLVTVPLILRRESRNLIMNMAFCALVLGILLGVTHLFQYLGQNSLIPADLAAWGPTLVSGVLGSWLYHLAQT